MGKRAHYGPGTFCWVSLSTTDVDAAKHFYAQLLGWAYDDRPGNGGNPFSMARRYDADVAAVYAQEEQERAQGAPSRWNNYVSVDDADGVAMRAEELGGALAADPFDVADAGRLAVIADVTGATFGAWQPRRHIGAGHVNDTGCLTWNDLSTDDAERAIAFYSALFGWRFEAMDTGGGPGYWTIRHDAAAMGINGGMRELSENERQAGAPPSWIPYFTVDSAASTAEKATASGGAALMEPAQVGAGIIAILKDPTGAVFGSYEGKVDD